MSTTVTVQATSVAPIAASTPKKKKLPTVPAHPTTAVMVTTAIRELMEKKGSSLAAIKKYLSANYRVDSTKFAPFIRKFLKSAVIKGTLVQTSGTGAMGHFRLADASKKRIATKKPAKVSSAVSPKKRKLAAKKVPTTAKPAAKKPKAAVAKPKKSLVKMKKAVVAPKPPKVKKTTAVKKTPKK